MELRKCQLPRDTLRIAVKLSGEGGWAVKYVINELGLGSEIRVTS